MDCAFTFAEKNAMCTERSYPYTAKDETCNSLEVAALVQQPVSIVIVADQSSSQLSLSGILTSSRGSRRNHGVHAVGYGSVVGMNY